MNSKNVNNLRIQKSAYQARIKLRGDLETKIAKLSPSIHSNRCLQLINQLKRLDKKIAEYEIKFRDTLTGEKE